MQSPDTAHRRRSSRYERQSEERARLIATRLGSALRESRSSAGFSQAEVAVRSGLSQTHISHLERGKGTGASLETWAIVAAAVGDQLVGFLERAPGADRPRDAEHLKRQNTLIRIAAEGGWRSLPELALDPGNLRSRSIDVVLVRRATGEAVVAEIWDWFEDVGAGLRSLDAKVATLAARQGPAVHIGALYVVRDTRRNRILIAEVRELFAARFGGSAHAWLVALTNPERRLPKAPGLLWSDKSGTALRPSRLNAPSGR